MKVKTKIQNLKVFLKIFTFYFLVFTFLGCEAFSRKFVRKPKKEKEIKVITQTQEYQSEYSIAAAYKKYFLFWQAAQDDLIDLVDEPEANHKKVIFTAEKIIENLAEIRQFLLPEKQEKLEPYILEQKKVRAQLTQSNLSRGKILEIKTVLEKQRRQIKKEFAYPAIQGYLIKE